MKHELAPSLVYEEFGSLDILINNAALLALVISTVGRTLSEQSYETWNDALNLNLSAVFDLCQKSVPFLSTPGMHP